MRSDRQGLIIWLNNLKHAKSLRRFGNIHYLSKKMKYIVLYCDRDEIEMLEEKIGSLPFVRKVEQSYKPFLKTEFENSKPDKAKEYDYKIGI
ncbi:YlbG family protein [Bacillus sp. FJAT-49736]|uniref:YlbG family protein n=1 Tax=Bacillus sp. FJAT-49736 TaxID=2833582 RepID=UPI001BC9B800|nr:YlbG family protein [Bacillus sp. FJAT-49736]MBS4172399.1 YlbG family protein [Bacillus sp. FJAT-49736]